MAECITSRWVSTAPRMKLVVSQGSKTDTTINLSWTLYYVATHPPQAGSVPCSATVDGSTVYSGSFYINGKTGTHRVASGTKTVTRTSSKTNVSFSCWVNWRLTWSGVYCGAKSANGSINIPAATSSSTPSTPAAPKPPPVPVITYTAIQPETDRTVVIEWEWHKHSTTKYYDIWWYYYTADGKPILASKDKDEDQQCRALYSAPSNAEKIMVKVKAIAKDKTVNGKTVAQWTADWSTAVTYNFSSNPPTSPGEPTVTIDKYTLTAELDDLDVNGTAIQFQVVKDNETLFATGTSNIIMDHASYSCSIDAGSEYKVRCRAVRDTLYSEWSTYSSNVRAIPSAPTEITVCKATSETSVYLEWTEVNSADTYDIEYTTKKNYFDNADSTSKVTGIEFTHFEKTGLEIGEEYFFRVRAVNEKGASGWSEDIKSVSIGKKPSPPTTWSSTTTAIVGEPLNLYWAHNAADGSSQTYAELEITIDGGAKETYTIQNDRSDDEKDKTSVYAVDTTEFVEGTKFQWRVRTAGVTLQYGDWSIERTVDVYAPPTLEFKITDLAGNILETVTGFPFFAKGLPGPRTQAPIGYYLTVVSNEIYETVDEIGNEKTVNAGETIYSKFFDVDHELMVEFSASNIDLHNNISYTVKCIVSMNSGLSVESTSTFTVGWTAASYLPNAEIGIDTDTMSAFIRPYCDDEDGIETDDVTLAVYRREFDGTFVEIGSGMDATNKTFVTDPHPALDYARYRIVATDKLTGEISYYDPPGYPIGESAVIIQWNEAWSTFDSTDEILAQPPWSGSMLKLPYNINVSENHQPDSSLVEYIGRKHPVTYYGTQRGESATWNVDVPKDDKETLYALRRLRNWMGDVYVREPSGSGYWANLTVSFSQKHLELTIPVTLNIKRVEGGM